ISHGDATALTRATADGFDDERVFSRVWRPWDAYEKGELGNRVRDTHDLLRKSHLIAPLLVHCFLLRICVLNQRVCKLDAAQLSTENIGRLCGIVSNKQETTQKFSTF